MKINNAYETSGTSPGQQSPWLTANEAALYLRVEPRTILQWARLGKLKGFALSGTKRTTWRFRLEDLDAFVYRSQPMPVVLSGKERTQ
jgi:excisionase family DNA binding protein